ncbi:S8 family peptidase [Thalassotalea sp. ND16A]|uniref:S8 family peptidase n=1 Tax=Thalassotalea sp. ND16A TaxID=1535422 RepID=UPI00051DA2F0|nr:S8 family peptidase [Thalassotalea sp. ND16A]KGJ90522.1 Cucumisin [Thalassotalea sp. ND16A]
MSKQNKIATSIATALYVAGLSAASAGVTTPPTLQPMPDFLKEVKITQAMQKNSDARKKRANRLKAGEASSNSFPTTNTHRAIAAKVDFTWEDDVSGINTYIVEFNEQAVALYDGRINGLKATNSKSRTAAPLGVASLDSFKLNPKDTDVARYRQHLISKQNQHIQQIKSVAGVNVDIKRTFQYALNGATIKLTQDKALAISKLPGVRNVKRSTNYQLHTDVGPKHIGADKIWTPNTLELANKGEGIVVGIIDTGINSDHPSFAEVAGDGYVHTNPRGQYYGDCEKAEFSSMCNDKLIGVRSYPVITDSYMDPVFQGMGSWITPENPVRPQNGEDYQGHGSHTASTTAGNELFDVPYTIALLEETGDGLATDLVFPHMSGVAPRANIIAYQVCFPGDGSFGDEWQPSDQYTACPGEALIAGIEDAITDGVDVINFSIGGSESSPWESPMEMAFLAAREAGISASLSAGNAGQSWVDHVSPWVTSVAATTHGRTISYSEKTLSELSGGDPAMMPDSWNLPYVGAGYTDGITGELVLATNYPDSDTNWDGIIDSNDANSDGMCNVPFPAGTFTSSQIVVCKRGEIARVEKAVNAQAGGAGGFILYNTDYSQDPPWGQSGPNDAYVIPGILLKSNVMYSLIPWLESGTGHMATINASTISSTMGEADYVADFSSRGPSRTTPDSMVPNVGAPGVNVYAAYADDMPFTKFPFPTDYSAISGTSMAAPHVAGAMALLTQLHPDWTPAEIQSALMSTANNNGTAAVGPWNVGQAGLDDYGSGVINVEAASRVGLVLDETGDNYRAADPGNGGNLPSLNEAYLYNTSCEFNCSWIRTFRATQDGTFNVTMNEHTAEGMPLLDLKASPTTFSLKAGEVQSVQFTAAAKDVSNFINEITDFPFEGDVIITPEDTMMPSQRLPMRVQFKSDGLPNDLTVEINRKMGSALSPRLYTKEAGDIRVNGLVKGQTQVHSLIPYQNGVQTDEGLAADIEMGAIAQINFTIPEGTKRFVFELTREKDRKTWHDSAIDVGFDVNGDGVANWNEETICYSFSYARDWCAIDNPTPGEYWALVGNYTIYDHNHPGDRILPLEMTTNLAIIPAGADDSLTTEIVGDANGIDGYNVNMTWNAEDAMAGDVYFAAVEFGRDAANAGDVGTMGVRFEHIGSDVMIAASQETAKTGDVVDFYIEAAANMMPSDRDFTLTATLPEGLNLSHDSVDVEGIYGAMTTVEGNTITISGNQPTSAFTPREYVWTTSETDELCRMPYTDGDFKDNWWDMGAFMMPTIIQGGAWDMFWVDPGDLGYDSITHYGKEWSGPVGLNPAGFFSLDPMGYMSFSHSAMEWVTFPDTMIAALWHAQAFITEPGMFDWDTQSMKGLYVATTVNNELVLQWNGMEVNDWWSGTTGSYSAQTIFKTKPDYNEGAYEVLFGYDRLDESLNGQGAIGTRGFHGFRNPWGPNEGWNADTFAINDVLDKTAVGMLVCGDYRGPEQSAIRVKFSALVNNMASGSTHEVVVTSDYEHAEQASVSTSVAVNGNLTMGQYNDITINEDEMVSGLEVLFTANDSTEKVISVSGENVSGTASGNVSGSTVDITPNADWNGSTEVTITVADAGNEGDNVSSKFTLTVNPMEDAPVAMVPESVTISIGNSAVLDASASYDMDDDSLTFSWSGSGTIEGPSTSVMTVSDLTVGEHEFEVTVSDGALESTASVMVYVEHIQGCMDSSATNYDATATEDDGTCTYPAPEPEAKKSSGGSFGGFAMLLMLIAGIRRKAQQ